MYFTTLCFSAELHLLRPWQQQSLLTIFHGLESCRCAVAGQTDDITLCLAFHHPAVVCTTRLSVCFFAVI
jgi:hypothetical protein